MHAGNSGYYTGKHGGLVGHAMVFKQSFLQASILSLSVATLTVVDHGRVLISTVRRELVVVHDSLQSYA